MAHAAPPFSFAKADFPMMQSGAISRSGQGVRFEDIPGRSDGMNRIMKDFRARVACRLSKLRRARRGGILSLTMITLPMLLGMAAIVVDLGILYIAKTKSETAAIFAAEAGAQRLPDIPSAETLAETTALTFLQDAGYVDSYSVSASATAVDISVTVEMGAQTLLADFIGIQRIDTSSTVTRP